MQRCTAQNQEERRSNVQDLRGVEDPALVDLDVKHFLHDGPEVRQQENIESREDPQQAAHKEAQPAGGLPPPSDGEEMVQTGQDYDRPLQSAVDFSKDLKPADTHGTRVSFKPSRCPSAWRCRAVTERVRSVSATARDTLKTPRKLRQMCFLWKNTSAQLRRHFPSQAPQDGGDGGRSLCFQPEVQRVPGAIMEGRSAAAGGNII
ncbi:hypothetical protein KUCAC02_018158 [Chaenocephalus aceratus]|uniref:Uncharacterized protein n=1 Tax=Chaenocephalus aceratus TaxID=36190 RepID=A0ACB9W947_CHAAC|nr:hypothetical protein KUCAC02_018158 [Chaenocephalus aceratus]